jgi:hypothetical protein
VQTRKKLVDGASAFVGFSARHLGHHEELLDADGLADGARNRSRISFAYSDSPIAEYLCAPNQVLVTSNLKPRSIVD